MVAEKRSWFTTGYDGIDKEKDRIARLNGPNRFWMKEGGSREVVFIDDDPTCLFEHSPQINGKWGNQFTCLRDTNDVVPCCEKLGDRSRYFVGYYTIVDCTESTDPKMSKYQFEMKLLPAKLKTLSLIRRKKGDRGSLINTAFKLHRDTRDDPNVGGEYEFLKEANMEKLFQVAHYRGKKLVDLYKEASEKPEVLQRLKDTFQLQLDASGKPLPKIFPFNYYSLLSPRDPREVRLMLGAASLGPEDSVAEGETDAVPF